MPASQEMLQVPFDQMEADFWDIVEKGEDPVSVLYGADLDTSVLGSGFPRPPGSLTAHCGASAPAANAQAPTVPKKKSSKQGRAAAAAAPAAAPLQVLTMFDILILLHCMLYTTSKAVLAVWGLHGPGDSLSFDEARDPLRPRPHL